MNATGRSVLVAWALVSSAGLAVRADVEPNAGMLRWPDVSATQIVFSYANDLWVVPKAGGLAQPVAGPPGQETFPKFSPDGRSIAFVGNYDGNRDLYTIPVGGGIPTRVTHHPVGETLCDWSPDGTSLMFLSNAMAGLARQSQLFTVPVGGGAYERLPVPYAGFGSVSPDGQWLAYTLHSTDTRTWKRYRGGMATDVWLFNLRDKSSRRITDFEGTDTLPMWVPGGDGKVVYYLSDAGPEHRLNIWAYDVAARTREQVTFFKDDDVRWPSVGPGGDGRGEIVFQLGSRLMLLDLSSRRAAEVKVRIPGDRPQVRERMVDASRNVQSASISPNAKRLAIQARGDVWTVPVKEGVVRNLTRTSGVAERTPSWSPDGAWIAYFSDETGEYELWVRPSDARPAEEKKDEPKKDEPKKDDAKNEDAAKVAGGDKPADPVEGQPAEASRAPRKLTDLGPGYRNAPTWSPDGKWITYSDDAGNLWLTSFPGGETKKLDQDPWMSGMGVSWSHDSAYVAYARGDEGNRNQVIWIADVASGEKKAVTSRLFSSYAPAFDRKGEWLFFASQRAINNPQYSDLDNTYAYRESAVLLMAPLRSDVKSPWLPKSDEETVKKDAKKPEPKKDEGKKDEGKKDDEKKNGGDAAADDGVSGSWAGTVKGSGGPFPPGGLPITMTMTLGEGGSVSGSISSVMGVGSFTGSYAKETGRIEITVTVGPSVVTMSGTLKDGQITGTFQAGEMVGEWNATRSAKAAGETKDEAKGEGGKKDDAKAAEKKLVIEFEGLERRAIQLPLAAGGFSQLAVADGEKLIFNRTSSRGGETGIRIYDYKADEKEEKSVTAGGGFQMTPDGKKLLVGRGGGNLTVVDAAAGGGKAQAVSTAGMNTRVDPRAEWAQILADAWRLQRDLFYEDGLHGVDWAKVRGHYTAMLPDAATREDVNWIIAEMISELNVGHAYLGNPGDVEGQPSVGVGLLGCDFELVKGDGGTAYRVAKVHEGGPWDADARGPLSQPGAGIKVGDFVLEVNGEPIDTSKDPYAAFVGTAGRVVALTVNDRPAIDGKEREVLVRTIGSEQDLRYRGWIESKRAYVEEKSGGRIGYIYVPNTGVDGQNDLYRQFIGQREKDALLIDERWNGGGQIPNRFIELLNRPITNYWARRHGNDWTWPPDGHQGPKAMLINGLAGSGGDMFPWLFRHHNLGKLIGTRTWGGLVGITGNPQFIDGGSITIPSFGFYKNDGTWGVEGHGVDPDIEVIDDPALMWNGGDPQLDAAIEHLLEELKTKAYTPPARPGSPTYRRGMGIEDKDK
ncbi:MAG: PD40 domain-containing protein [Phycisphaeraceae bacterium]|nr:MAG: PD40 domain-containing protein [Phycisphaeraceae bacterium]